MFPSHDPKQPLKTNDGSGYGILHQISLEGTILLSGADSLNSGIKGLTKNIDQFKKALDHDGKPLVAYCRTPSDTSPEAGPDIADWNLVLSGYPTIGGYTIESPDNYTRRANYTVDFTMPTLFSGSYTGADPFNSGRAPASPPPFIESVSESWDVEFKDERMPSIGL